jgi:hypothetical protein
MVVMTLLLPEENTCYDKEDVPFARRKQTSSAAVLT